MADDKIYRIDSIKKDPAESRKIELRWFDLCANIWQGNEDYAGNEYVRPNVATGFAYQANGAGTSSAREPRWPTALGASIADGSITWTCVATGANGLNVVSAPSAVSDPVGITISSVSVSEFSKVLATYAGGIDGQDYDAVFTVTIDGILRVARQTIHVRRR